jgi:hypothetical protein
LQPDRKKKGSQSLETLVLIDVGATVQLCLLLFSLFCTLYVDYQLIEPYYICITK